MAVFVQDSFTDVDGTALEAHVGEVGAVWTPRTAVYPATAAVIEAGRVRFSQAPGGGSSFYASGVPSGAEYDVECDLYINARRGEAVGVIARALETVNTMYLARLHQDNVIELYRFVNGSLSQIGNVSYSVTTGQTIHLKLEVRNASKRVLVDGVEVISSPDNTITHAGRVGIQSYRDKYDPAPGIGVHVDNFTATDLSGGTPDPVTVTADFTPIPVTSYGAGIVQGQQVAADYTQVPIETYGAGVVISPVEIGASFDQIPVTSYGAGVEISPVEVGASYTAIPVTSYDAQAIPGSTGIGATYTEVPVYSYDPGIIQGQIVSAAYDEIAVTTYDAAVIPGAIGIGADFTQIDVSTFDASITQGVGIGAEYTEIPVTSFAASIIQGLRIQAAFTQIPVVSYSAEIVDGSIVRPNRMDCSVSPYYDMTATVSPYWTMIPGVAPYYDMTPSIQPKIL